MYAFNYADSANSSLNGWYTYKKNIQGDILGIVDSAGNEIVNYKYNAWGKILSTTGTKASTIGAYNEYLYRGYRYDRDLSLYYLQSRYYDSETCRFINADNMLLITKNNILSNNLFAYCSNDPINYIDNFGYAKAKIKKGTVTLYRTVEFSSFTLKYDVVGFYTNGNWTNGLATLKFESWPVAIWYSMDSYTVNAKVDSEKRLVIKSTVYYFTYLGIGWGLGIKIGTIQSVKVTLYIYPSEIPK